MTTSSTSPETTPSSGGPQPPHPREVLTQLAQAGDLNGLTEAILYAPRDQVSPGEAYELLRETLQRLGKDQDPASFSDQLFARWCRSRRSWLCGCSILPCRPWARARAGRRARPRSL